MGEKVLIGLTSTAEHYRGYPVSGTFPRIQYCMANSSVPLNPASGGPAHCSGFRVVVGAIVISSPRRNAHPYEQGWLVQVS